MGKATARKLLADGHTVYALARREEKMRDLAQLGAVVVAGDVTDERAPLGIDVVVIEPGLIDTEFAAVVSAPLLDRSGSGPYASLAAKVAEGTRTMYESGATPPSVIADVIAKAVTARRPRTRYVAGKYARMLMTIRKWLGDRIYDRAVMARL
jgi:NAD(P)-dependent dehydrogenase (short-subunit alcohol dehydrogenase family)